MSSHLFALWCMSSSPSSHEFGSVVFVLFRLLGLLTAPGGLS